ncbi:MAG: ArsR/SmtB family transcription factor [Burkholderiaceae bacterium]
MDDEPNIARIATLLADPARAKILWTLIDGTTRPAGELAFAANISAQSASAHLAKLVDGGLLTTEALGRHRYYRIANAEVAHMIESMASFSVAVQPRAPRSPALVKKMPSHFLHARTCYDHLAGETAVKVLDGMLKAGWLSSEGQDFIVTRAGEKKLTALGIDLEEARTGRRVFARACVDLTQRRYHLGGTLGAALLTLYVKQGWIQRAPRSRVVSITPKGQQAFKKLY